MNSSSNYSEENSESSILKTVSAKRNVELEENKEEKIYNNEEKKQIDNRIDK